LLRSILAGLALTTIVGVVPAQKVPAPARPRPPQKVLAPAQPQSAHKLLVISIDGMDARFLSEPALHLKVPNMRRLMKEGASATVVGVAPSETWPAHASLVTGVSPWQSGILSNVGPGANDRYFAASAFKTETLWDAAGKSGRKVGTIYWPSTLGANVAFDFPEYWQARKGNAVPLDPIVQKATPNGIGARVAKMFPAFEKELWDDSSSANAALCLLGTDKPDVLFMHMAEADAEQHETTALSIYAREILENDDDLIGQILKRLEPGTMVALVSDHGFENNNRTIRPKVLLRQAGVKGRVEVADGLIGTPDAPVADELRKLMAAGKKNGIAREVKMAEVKARAPALGRWVAAFDTMPDYVASDEEHGPGVGPGSHNGAHGFWPTRPGYRSVFILSGEGIRPVKLGEIDMLQIAPTLADAIGVRLPAAKSQSLWKTVSK
jgi:predicted AlkP superfamily pyrophosphatase or phosphodiesterase